MAKQSSGLQKNKGPGCFSGSLKVNQKNVLIFTPLDPESSGLQTGAERNVLSKLNKSPHLSTEY